MSDRLQKISWLAALLGSTVAAVLGWALFWPETSCAQPACARQRFSLAIELDALRQVPAIEFTVAAGDEGTVSLQSILASGGIDVSLQPDQLDLPYIAASGALDRADLYQFASAWRDNSIPEGMDAKIYALLAAELISDTGEPLFGIMFDDMDREGFAVAPATTAAKFGDREPGSIAILQLRTFVHELLHALNRRHLDAAQMQDGRLTLEAPTRCISGQYRGEWFLQEPPLLAISPDTIRFFQSAPRKEILPGRQNAGFRKRGSPTECEDARANIVRDPAGTRWQLAAWRLRQAFSIQAARAADEVGPDAQRIDAPATDQDGEEAAAAAAQREESDASPQQEPPLEPAPPAVDLRIQALPAAYPLGYPIALRLMARNDGPEPLAIKNRLMPSYGMVHIEYRAATDADWRNLQPLAWFEPASDEEAMLDPGASTEQTVPIYFGDEGWAFTRAGEYQVRATLHTGKEVPDVVSQPVTITIETPRTAADEAALQPLLNEQGELDDGVGRLLIFGGRIGADQTIAPLEDVVQEHGDTALGSALRLTLISQRLRRPIDPLTGIRPPPDLGAARDLLQDTCTDSGIAALKYQLLMRHSDSIPDAMSRSAHSGLESGAAAWDGTSTPRGDTMPTYSDSALNPWGPTIHFCFNDADLRGDARQRALRAARALRRAGPQRVVIVGHGDFEGACRHNDALGLRRAATLRQMLIDQGIPGRRIQIASLGERRPLDFSSTVDARDLNRRVEILVEMDGMSGDAPEAQPIKSHCVARPAASASSRPQDDEHGR